MSVVGDSDERRLAPDAVRAGLRRRAAVALVAGVVAGVVTALRVDAGGPESIWKGSVVLVVSCLIVFLLGSFRVVQTAGRELEAVTHGDGLRHKRIRKAVVRGRIDSLVERDRLLVPQWAAAAEPLQSVGLLSQVLAMGAGVVGAAAGLSAHPDDVFRRWLLGFMLLAASAVIVVALRDWRRVRAAAPDRNVRRAHESN